MSLRDQLLQTARAYTTAHNEQDWDGVQTLCSLKCVHRAGPVSIKNPDRNNDEYITFNTEVFKMMHTYHAEITDAVADEISKEAVLYLHAKATADAGEYENEYIITLTMTDDGKKVVAVNVYLDCKGGAVCKGYVGNEIRGRRFACFQIRF
jgi:hypothetical protein